MEDNKYKIKDLAVGYGVFVRLNFPFKLKSHNLIHMGESFAVLKLLEDEDAEDKDAINVTSKLIIKIFGGASNGEGFLIKGFEN